MNITVKVTLNGTNQRMAFNSGITIEELIEKYGQENILACTVNDKPVDLSYTLTEDSDIKFYTWDDKVGKQVFLDTCAYLLEKAISELYQDPQFGAISVFGDSIFSVEVQLNTGRIAPSNLGILENKVVELIKRKYEPFKYKQVSRNEAIKIFANRGETYRCEVISNFSESEVITICTSGSFCDYCSPRLLLINPTAIKRINLVSKINVNWQNDPSRGVLFRVYGVASPY